jgi:hypothetical protein
MAGRIEYCVEADPLRIRIGKHGGAVRSGITKTEVIIGVFIAVAIVVAAMSALFLDTTGKGGPGLGSDSVYDIEALTEVDPALILYAESAAAIDTGFKKARSIAVDGQGHIYVAGDESIKIFDKNGAVLKTADSAGRVQAVAVDAEGGVYAGLRDHVEVYDSNLKRAATWKGLGESAVITSIAVSKDGDVFVADAGNRIVVRYDKSGGKVNDIGEKNDERNVPGFIIPSPHFDLVIPRDGMLRAVNPGRQRVEAYTFAGDFEFAWGRAGVDIEGFCGCCNPVSIAVLPDDSFVTCEKGLNRVKVYDHDGRFKGVVAGPKQLAPGSAAVICTIPEQCQAGGFDVAADSEGNIYVLDTIRNVIRKFVLKKA